MVQRLNDARTRVAAAIMPAARARTWLPAGTRSHAAGASALRRRERRTIPRHRSIVAPAPKDAHLYCCGPAPMLKAFEAATKDWPREQVHIEYFTPKEQGPPRRADSPSSSRVRAWSISFPRARPSSMCCSMPASTSIFLRARHLRGLRAAGDLRHSGAPRFHPQRRGAVRKQTRDDLLRRLQERAAGAGYVTLAVIPGRAKKARQRAGPRPCLATTLNC